MPDPLRFGTDGWRGVIAEDFTFANVRRIAAAFGLWYRAPGRSAEGCIDEVVLGYDTRFAGREAMLAAAEVLRRTVPRVVVSDRPLPTPAISWAVKERALAGGLVITASHNPAPYNGVKFKAHYGGSASPETYAEIAALIDSAALAAGPPAAGTVQSTDLTTPYRARLASLVDLERIRLRPLRVLADPMYGALGRSLEEMLAGGTCRVTTLHADANPGFGGTNPEPIGENLSEATATIAAGGFDIGVASDGDADRCGLIDDTGEYVTAHEMYALLLLYLVRHRGWHGGIAKTFSTTMLLETMAERLGVPLVETGIGFKYIAPLMLRGEAQLGGEESGGMAFGFHLPERDSLLTQLLLLEMLAVIGEPLSAIRAGLHAEFGRYHYQRRDAPLPLEHARTFLERLRRHPPQAIAGETVTQRADRGEDGVKFYFGAGNRDGWLLFRGSGTEPMLRVYCEHRNAAMPARMLAEALQLVGGRS